MTRTLPWSTQKPRVKPKATAATPSRPVKRQRLLDPNSDDEALCASPAPAPQRKVMITPRQADREPSTSPIPDPPVEELMREGLHADDIYIMVEDEFYSMARSFTRHLHHAEYKRLKNLARSRNTSNLTKISRPVDPTTTMRVETRKKKEQQERGSRLEEAVNKLGTKISSRAKTTGQHEDSDEAELVRHDDPWTGTHLDNLMTSSSKTHKSLMGLQGIASSSRAAAGLKPPKGKVKMTREFDLAPRDAIPRDTGGDSGIKEAEGRLISTDTTDGEDDDDLDAPVGRHEPPFPSSGFTTKSNVNAKGDSSAFQRPPDRGKKTGTGPKKLHATKKIPDAKAAVDEDHAISAYSRFDGFSQPTPLRSRHAALKGRIPRKKPDDDLVKGGVEVIPTFVI